MSAVTFLSQHRIEQIANNNSNNYIIKSKETLTTSNEHLGAADSLGRFCYRVKTFSKAETTTFPTGNGQSSRFPDPSKSELDARVLKIRVREEQMTLNRRSEAERVTSSLTLILMKL